MKVITGPRRDKTCLSDKGFSDKVRLKSVLSAKEISINVILTPLQLRNILHLHNMSVFTIQLKFNL